MGGENLLISSEWMGSAVRQIEAAEDGLAAVFLQGCAGNQSPYREQKTFGQIDELGRGTSVAVREALSHADEIPPVPLENAWREIPLPLDGGGTSPCPMHGLRLGDAVMVGLGGEAFVEYALYARERSSAKSTLLLGYTDGSVNYLPTEAAFAEGGYEVEAYTYFSGANKWHPAIERTLKAAIDKMLRELSG